MKAAAGASVAFKPSSCCGRKDYEYSIGGTKRAGQTIEAWVWLRCVHCKTTHKIIGYCKQAGDGDTTNRQRRYRQNKDRKFATPSTAVRVIIE